MAGKKIADISKWQGAIDWARAARELAFCILRASCGVAEDTRFADNAQGCIDNRIPYHAYHYLMASDETRAKTEATFFFKTASVLKPVFYVVDVEDSCIPAERARSIVSTFIGRLRELGARNIGIYIAHHRYAAYDLDVSEADYIWIPRYGTNSGVPETPPAYACDLWQYTSKGTLAGVNGNVDLNELRGERPLGFFIECKEGSMSETPRAQTPFTNEHFAAFMEQMIGRPYWYGTCVSKCSKSLWQKKAAQYPEHYRVSDREEAYKAHISAKEVCADCIGAAKGYAWTNGGAGVVEAIGTDGVIACSYGSNSCPDKSADGMFAYAKEKGSPYGSMDSMPEVVGIALRRSGHVGYYIGNGRVVEFRGFADGCVEAPLDKTRWTHWYMLPFIDYGDADIQMPAREAASENAQSAYALGARLLKKGHSGGDVAQLQQILVGLGYDIGDFGVNEDGVDGAYGNATEKAVRRLQTAMQISVDGIYGAKTHTALMGVISERDNALRSDDAVTVPKVDRRVTVTASTVNVRSGPSTIYEIIARVFAGAELQYVATAEAYGWHAVDIGGQIGWVSGKYTEVKEG